MSVRIDVGAEATSPSDAEREAVRLYYEKGADLSTISALTGLSTKAIRAATDRVAVSIAGPVPKREAAPQQDAAPRPTTGPATKQHRPAPRQRVVRPAQLPGAHTPPSTVDLPLRELVAPADVRPATAVPTPPAAPVQAVPEPADDGPGSPAWTAQATSPEVRAWAVADGWQVPPPGRSLPGAIVLAYRAAHPGGAS